MLCRQYKDLLIRLETESFENLVKNNITETTVKAFDKEQNKIVDAPAFDIRIEKYADTLKTLYFADGTSVSLHGQPFDYGQ